MGIFDKFKNKRSGEAKHIEPTPTGGDAVGIRQTIKTSSLSLLDSLYLSEPRQCVNKHLVVWLDTDGTTFNAYSGFEQELMQYWSVERGYVFESVVLKRGKPDKDGRKLPSFEGLDVFIQERLTDPATDMLAKVASVTVFSGKGSMMQECYLLSCEALKKEHRKYYNIGRGTLPKMDDGSVRQNHIAIDDKNNLELNSFVSRAHARIGYSEQVGFYLQVERGGSRLSGNRTRVFRDEETIEVENLDLKVPLKSGDLIELGKAVVLKYEEIG